MTKKSLESGYMISREPNSPKKEKYGLDKEIKNRELDISARICDICWNATRKIYRLKNKLLCRNCWLRV